MKKTRLLLCLILSFCMILTAFPVYADTESTEDTDAAGYVGAAGGTDANLTGGNYTIYAGTAENKALDISGASLDSCANVQIYQDNGTKAQIFHVENLGNGLYSIQNINSGKMLDAAGASSANGTNIWQYSDNGSAAQRWYITNDYGTDAFTVRSAIDTAKVLDVAGGSSSSGANVQLYSSNSTAAQKWRFVAVESGNANIGSGGSDAVTNTEVADGLYTFIYGKDQSKCLDVYGNGAGNGTNVQIYTSNNSNAQKFLVRADGDGYYSIVCLGTAKALDVANGSSSSGTNIWQYTPNGTAAQKWKFMQNADGTLRVVSKLGDCGLDVVAGSTADGANVQLYALNGTAAQSFILKSTTPSAMASGDYIIRAAVNQSYVLDVAAASTASGANVQLYSANGTDAQNFALESSGNGYYIIRCLISNCVLDATGAGKVNGTNIQQYTANGTDAQYWSLKATGDSDGSFYIINKNSGLYLNIANAAVTSGANIELYEGENGAEKFFFQRTTATHHIPGVLAASGGKTVKNLLQNALKPCGKALYILGGAHGNAANRVWSDLSPTVTSFFNSHATSGYNWENYNALRTGPDDILRFEGFDCSGFVGWSIYNTFNSVSGGTTFDDSSSRMPAVCVERGLAYYSTNSAFLPGDIAATGYHTWIVLGKCSDGSQVLLQSAITKQDSQPGCNDGVQLSGTPVLDANGNTISNDSQAVILARKYMAKYFSSWPYAVSVQDANYTKAAYITKATWYTDGANGHLSDPDGYQSKTAAQILEDLLGPA